MGLKALHFTDMHEDTVRLEAVNNIVVGENIDLVFFTGDAIGHESGRSGPQIETLDDKLNQIKLNLSNSSHSETINRLGQTYGTNGRVSLVDITTESDRQEFMQAMQGRTIEAAEQFESAVNESYSKLISGFEKIKSNARIIGVAGNHDTKHLYGALGDIIDFVENTEEFIVKGSSGEDFRIQGTPNTYEVPRLYQQQPFGQFLELISIDYDSGLSESDAQGNEDLLKIIKEATQREQSRLGTEGADIFFTHKAPGGRFGSGAAAAEYQKISGMTIGGHYHEPSIIKLNGKMVFNPGPDHFFVYHYNDDKLLGNVDVYKITGQVVEPA